MIQVCFAFTLLSELLKLFYDIRIVPVVEPAVENGTLIYRQTGAFTPYLEAEHLPFELCSYQLFFMAIALLIKDGKRLRMLYALMFSTCIIGGAMALFLPSAAIGLSSVSEFLGNINVWRAFLYHAMLIVLGIYIGISEECGLHFRDIKWSFLLVGILDFVSFYLNSMLSTPYYSGDTLMGVGNAVNYFSSYNNPLGIVMSDKRQWFLYLLIRIAAATVLITLLHLPLLKKDRKAAYENS